VVDGVSPVLTDVSVLDEVVATWVRVPAASPRYTWYPTTPVSSEDALQEAVAEEVPTFEKVGAPGVVGGVVSPAGGAAVVKCHALPVVVPYALLVSMRQ
jgi:hypothetical protein